MSEEIQPVSANVWRTAHVCVRVCIVCARGYMRLCAQCACVSGVCMCVVLCISVCSVRACVCEWCVCPHQYRPR